MDIRHWDDGQDLVDELVRRHDPIGFVSVYADADPERQSTQRPAWRIEVENALRGIEQGIADEPDEERRALIARSLRDLRPLLDRLLAAAGHGRGRAAFAPITGGPVDTLAFQLPLPTLAVLDRAPHVWPLVVAADRGHPVGVVALGGARVRVLEYRYGMADDVEAIAVDLADLDWRPMVGPAPAQPGYARHSASQRDRYERRAVIGTHRALAAIGETAAEIAEERGWSELVVAGDPRLAHAITPALEGNGTTPIVVDRVLAGETAAAIARSVDEALERHRHARHRELAERARTLALSGGPAVLGIAPVLDAFEAGRVAHLLIDETHGLHGGPDERFVERMVERAITEGATVTPLGGDAAALGDPEGVAALLRW